MVDRKAKVAANWSFKNMMQHWNRKHAQAAYVPSLFREPPPEYSYGPRILLCEQTDFILFLKAITEGIVYYDPAIKLIGGSQPDKKRRSQFRVKHKQITDLYYRSEVVEISI
ncbi:MvaI/BcnI family restriction endonuclease [Bradyrhizobium yuanmingense]|uniref:MvaI/BcnI family restriction endonuclease n=1 Tax=Bradyrhizobium yuanmingense TaxID=108015 RepID=UPI0023ED5E07|nr:MvaI/BcnI family restriction endonuclease [Bradyrhizobium yuanmingense]